MQPVLVLMYDPATKNFRWEQNPEGPAVPHPEMIVMVKLLEQLTTGQWMAAVMAQNQAQNGLAIQPADAELLERLKKRQRGMS